MKSLEPFMMGVAHNPRQETSEYGGYNWGSFKRIGTEKEAGHNGVCNKRVKAACANGYEAQMCQQAGWNKVTRLGGTT